MRILNAINDLPMVLFQMGFLATAQSTRLKVTLREKKCKQHCRKRERERNKRKEQVSRGKRSRKGRERRGGGRR